MDAVLAFMKRANDVYHVKCFVQLTRKEYAELRALTAAHDTYRRDFDDEDGVCTFELRDGDLYLRTADGELKAVMDEDALKQRESASADGLTKVVMTPTSPVGRFGQYCRSAGLDAEHYMHFQKVLKNEALLDSIVAAKGQQRKAAFVYVAQMPAGAATEADAVRTVSAPLACCAGSFEVHVALVRRKGVDIGCVIKRLRHARIDKTLQLLQQPGLTDALVARVAPARAGAAAAPASTPRARFIGYVTTWGVSLADATAFADALHDDPRLDAIVLLKDRDGVYFSLLVNSLEGLDALMDHIKCMPERLRVAMCIGTCVSSVDVDALVARLRLVDPFRTRAMLAATTGVEKSGMTFGNQPLQTASEADRVCAACGLREQPAPSHSPDSAPAVEARTLKACGACRLVLYCGAACQKGHWPEHKKACKAAREALCEARVRRPGASYPYRLRPLSVHASRRLQRISFPRAMDPASLQRGTYVQLPPSEFAQALAETRRTGTFTADYHDEDGVCTFELRGDNLFLRTAGGQLKAVFDMDVSRVVHSDSPLERFIQYCRVVDVGSEQAMHFQKLLNNEALLDCVIAWTPPNERNAAFIYVTQLPAGTELTNQNVAWSIGVPFASCATSHNVMVALVRRRDVDIGRLVKNLRRARGTETLRLLQQPDMADAMITRIMRMTSSQLAEAQASHCAMPASTPAETAARSRFVQYVTPYGVTKADAAAFADALDDDDRLDATVLSTDKDGASFYVLAHGVILAQQPEPLMSNINRLPERLRAATHLMPFIMSVDLHAEAARLRRTDPFRMRNMLAAMPGKHGNETHFGSQQPVRSAIAADRVCVACGWHEPPGGAAEERKLRACGACRLVLYCCKECQTSHWKKHKPACKAARDAARTGK